MEITNREWKEFKVESIFNVINLKAYHKKQLKSSNKRNNNIPYITRTNKDNGVEDIVENNEEFKINAANTIVFGAENATFFYQPFKYISGNKMYAIESDKINKYTGLFIQQMLNTSVKNCGFGYGQGLTGTRERKRSIILPVSKGDEVSPDWGFIEEYIKRHYYKKQQLWTKYIDKKLSNLHRKKISNLKDKTWKEFSIEELFKVSIGKNIDGNKVDKLSGYTAYITRKESDNGVDGFINNDIKKMNCRFPVITIGN